MNAFCKGCSFSAEPSPSSVVILASFTAAAGVTHERTGFPSTSTVHAPHGAIPHPNFAAFSSRSLRRTYSSGVSGAAGNVRRGSLTVGVLALLALPGQPFFAEQGRRRSGGGGSLAIGGATVSGASSRTPTACRSD